VWGGGEVRSTVDGRVTPVEGRGPSVKDGRKKQRRTWAIDDESSHPELCSEVVGGVTRNIVSLFREPDAGNSARISGGCGKRAMVRLMRHRQMKGPDSARPHLKTVRAHPSTSLKQPPNYCENVTGLSR